MTIQIAIIGLGQTGLSVGLALAEHKEHLQRTGHDIDPARARQAEKLGAVDGIHFNLPAAVEKAGLVVLALPLDQIRPTLEVIAPVLPKGALVVDLAPVKQSVLEWARQTLPPERYFIGLTPVRNPAYLDAPEADANTGHADFFHHSIIAVVTPPGTPPEANRLATDFIGLLGAGHLFVDPFELDGLVTATHLLPGMLAAALVHATMLQPGWQEARKFTDVAYASATQPAVRSGTAAALAGMALNAPENTLRVLDNTLRALQTLRALVAKGDPQELQEYFDRARYSRDEWRQERNAGNWNAENEPRVEMPTASQVFGQLFRFGKPKDPKSKP